MSAQVNHDLLADYVGGALDGTPEHDRVAGLVATDPDWGHAADTLTAALEAVDRDLALLRGLPEPMPEEVSARFDQLLANPGRDALAPRVIDRASDRVGQRDGRSRRWRRWAAPVAIAAAALALFGIGKLPSMLSPMTAQEAGSSDARVAVDAPGAPGAPESIATPVPTVTTAFNYDRDTLRSKPLQPPAVAEPQQGLRTNSAPDKAAAGSGSGALARLSDPASLGACLATVTAVLPGRVDAVEYAAFEGNPALVISLTTPLGPWRFVAGPGCGRQGPDERFRTPVE